MIRLFVGFICFLQKKNDSDICLGWFAFPDSIWLVVWFNLEQVEIVMGLEEEFGISVEEESAQSIVTVQDAADLIEKLIEKKGA